MCPELGAEDSLASYFSSLNATLVWMHHRWRPILLFSLALSACLGESIRPESGRGPNGNADSAGSCQDVCGEKSESGCWCDDECSFYGDCCNDKFSVCASVEPGLCGGLAEVPCLAGEYCRFGQGGTCGAGNATGICVPNPESCTEEVLSVCGCDGTTYENNCLANAAGSDVARDGSCGIDPDAGPGESVVCDFFADPVLGDLANDGSEQSPWGSLGSVLASGQDFSPGDVICLRAGNHGDLAVVNRNYSGDIAFVGIPGETATATDLRIEASSGIVFRSIVFDASSRIDPTLDQKDQFIVRGGANSHHLVFLNVIVKSADSIDTWTKDDWYKKSKGGFDMRGGNISVRNSQILNTYHAISLRGDYSELTNTLIDNFAGDAIRGLGSFSRFESNTVRDAYVNDYAIQHDDLFQSFKFGDDPKVQGVTIRNNRFMQFLDPITPFVESNDLVSHELQGIIITDGYADGWIVENNLVTVDHFHGITLYGARHCRVQNNTVVQPPHTSDTDVPWVRLTIQTKTGQTNFDNTIRNNLAGMFTTGEYHSTSVVENNSDFNQADQGEYRRYFSGYDAQNYELSATSPAINAGVNVDVLAVDLLGNARISGGIVDTGAFELQE